MLVDLPLQVLERLADKQLMDILHLVQLNPHLQLQVFKCIAVIIELLWAQFQNLLMPTKALSSRILRTYSL
jgi:hypothetical protein